MFLTDERLAKLLVENKLLTQGEVDAFQQLATESRQSLESVILDSKKVDEKELGILVAKELQVPFITLSEKQVPEKLFRLLPEKISRKQKIVVFDRDQEFVHVAMANPTRDDLAKLLAKKTGLKTKVYLATKSDIEKALTLFKRDLQHAVDLLIKYDNSKLVRPKNDDPPVAKIVETLISSAFDERASDIHMEPQEGDAVVRLRIDGILHEVLRVSKLIHERMVTRIKVLSSLRTDEHLSAQDGKMRATVEDERLDVRVSIVPIADGEKVVMRLLSAKAKSLTLADLGMSHEDLVKVERAYKRSFGMILSTGPTGSGKTTSIYSILRILNSPEKNITSVEDPVEYRIPGANQIQVNTKTNLTFANGLRSILRQDPNIIFVGEIRDSETAGIAVNAALTGHLVLSTLHTNDAATALPRLIDMKVESFLVASTVNIIIAQRLVRKICQSCKSELPAQNQLELFNSEIVDKLKYSQREIKFFAGTGCKLCRGTGYLGRIGLYEVLEVTEGIRKLIVEKTDADVLQKTAVAEGMKTMLEDGLEKIFSGLTTVEEVLRVTKTDLD